MYAPIVPGIFSREKDLYGATMCVEETCHADPSLATESFKNVYILVLFLYYFCINDYKIAYPI